MISDRVINKFNRLLVEKQQLTEEAERLETDWYVLTDQYMNGNILGPIGKEQNRIKREIEKRNRKVCRINRELENISLKYGLPL